jgi:prolipoprotein diacylglyceryl transferase
MIGLAGAYFVVQRLYKEQKIKDELFEPLFFYCFFGILAGARLGHCIFYEPQYYFADFPRFIEMLLPIRFTSTGVRLIGYQGLASHGGTLGLMIALWLYVRKYKVGLWNVLDDIAIATPVTACCIRLGNLMNSEIIGRPTGGDFGFIFTQVDMLPRHPAQLYEAIAYALFGLLGWYLYRRMPRKVGTGFFFGYCLTTIFTFRFFVEFFKEVQSDFEVGMPLDMGQLLSIPFVILGVWCMIRSTKKKHKA